MQQPVPTPLSPHFGIFYRGDHRVLPRFVTIDVGDPSGDAPALIGRLRDCGATGVRLALAWNRHAVAPSAVPRDVDDAGQPNVSAALDAVRDAGLDLWMAPGPRFDEVPLWLADRYPETRRRDGSGHVTANWSVGHPDFVDAVIKWVRGVAHEVVASGVSVNFWEVDLPFVDRGPRSETNPETIARFQQWLRLRYPDAAALAREWLTPTVTFAIALPPMYEPRRRGGNGLGWARLREVLHRAWGRLRSHNGTPTSALALWPEQHRGVRTTSVDTTARHVPGDQSVPGGAVERPRAEAQRAIASVLAWHAYPGLAPGQCADWHDFLQAERSALGATIWNAVASVLPGTYPVAPTYGWAGLPGIGHRRLPELGEPSTRPTWTHEALPVAHCAPDALDAAWVAQCLGARASDERPIIVSLSTPTSARSIVGAITAAVGAGAMAICVPASAVSDPSVVHLLRSIERSETDFTATTALHDGLSWLDDPAHAGADPDDYWAATTAAEATISREATTERVRPWSLTFSGERRWEPDRWRTENRQLYRSLRTSGYAVTIVDPTEFLGEEGISDRMTLVVPSRRWIDLERYGALVVYALRGGNLVTLPKPPRRQRDGTAFRTTFLWPAAGGREVSATPRRPVSLVTADGVPCVGSSPGVVFHSVPDVEAEILLTTVGSVATDRRGEHSRIAGHRVQVHDGTSTLLGFVVDGENTPPFRRWIGRVTSDVPRHIVPEDHLELLVSLRLHPAGGCLLWVANPTETVQSGLLKIPNPATIGIVTTLSASPVFAPEGTMAGIEGACVRVVVPPHGGIVVLLSSP